MVEPQTEVYLDNSATTKPCKASMLAIDCAMQDAYFNPSALYKRAVQAERAIQQARETVAAPLGLTQKHVIFTSGGTESDNLAIIGYLHTLRESGTVLYSAAEHPAVKNACKEAAILFGHTTKEIPIDRCGIVDLAALEGLLNPQVRLICVMQVCNETGAIMPIRDVVALRDRLAPRAAIHVDGVQGYLRVPFSMKDLNVQSYAISAHKFHGPKGMGALIVQNGHPLQAQIVGGGQQNNLRSGTENTFGIAGMAAAIQAYPSTKEACELLGGFKQMAYAALNDAIADIRVLGPMSNEKDAAPHILYVALSPVRAETMVHALESVGVMVGTGSACSSHKRSRSEVLTAMGIPPMVIDSSVRLSFAVDNTVEQVQYAVEQMIQQYKLLARFTRR